MASPVLETSDFLEASIFIYSLKGKQQEESKTYFLTL